LKELRIEAIDLKESKLPRLQNEKDNTINELYSLSLHVNKLKNQINFVGLQNDKTKTELLNNIKSLEQ